MARAAKKAPACSDRKLFRAKRPRLAQTAGGNTFGQRAGVAGQTDYPREIVEACRFHASDDAVELAYRRTAFVDKRRALMEGVGALLPRSLLLVCIAPTSSGRSLIMLSGGST